MDVLRMLEDVRRERDKLNRLIQLLEAWDVVEVKTQPLKPNKRGRPRKVEEDLTIHCPDCPNKNFATARALGVHRTKVHFGNSSLTGSTLRQ